MGAALKFKQPNVGRQANELARLKVVRGPDLGAIYVVTASRATIGRGEENDVVLSDLRTSRKHAEIVFSPGGGWSVVDAGSSNGITFNGKPVKTSGLKSRDTIGLGETVLEFASSEAGTQILTAPPSSLEQLQGEQLGLQVQRAKVIAMSQFGGLAKNVPRPDQLTISTPRPSAGSGFGAPVATSGSGLDPKKLLLIVGALGAGYMLFMAEEPKPAATKKAKSEKEAKRDLSSFLPGTEDPAVEKTADVFYKSGFREYRAGNYLRAKTQFETVLQISPNHALAKLYLENCAKAIDDDVKSLLELGGKSYKAGKLKEARGHFEAVLRLLYRDQQNPAFIEAKDQIEKIGKELKEGSA